MKYETPKLTALTPAIDAIQTSSAGKPGTPNPDGPITDSNSAYEDWE